MKLEIVTWSVKSPAGRGVADRSHGGAPRAAPHSESWSCIPHGRVGTPRVTEVPTCMRFLIHRTLRTRLPEREILYVTRRLMRLVTQCCSCSPPTRYGLQRPWGGCAVSM